MSLTRRRFLAISAVALSGAGIGLAHRNSRWTGVALGADVSIDIAGADDDQTRPALTAALETIRRMERLFSLYDPQSMLSQLNRQGAIEPDPEFSDLLNHIETAHKLTGGLFDPTVQPLFKARLEGRPVTPQIMDQLGWHHVDRGQAMVRYKKPGMAMTFNGIAQGFATDKVTEALAAHGFARTLVNMGEYRAGDRLAVLGIGGANEKTVGTEELCNAAISTSVPGAFRFAGQGSHIFNPANPDQVPGWASATVIAGTATMADALSTALVLAPDIALAERLTLGPAAKVILEDLAGNMIRPRSPQPSSAPAQYA
jgi:FAD:protein FMN transferase